MKNLPAHVNPLYPQHLPILLAGDYQLLTKLVTIY